ncbi:MAG: copper resistance system multicopper oxidase [Gemmatimonas sp.]
MLAKLTRRMVPLAAAAVILMAPAFAGADSYDLVIDKGPVNTTGKERTATLINGQLPGPALRFKEGEDVTVRVTNRLSEPTSIHWHGLLLPSEQDGVPGVSNGFRGIQPGETYTYRFPIKQAGTYWYHSHSATQEQTGMYAPIIIEPKGREPFRYDRDYVVVLSDWTDENPDGIVRNLKLYPGYYNEHKRTLVDFFRDAAKDGFGAALRDRKMWGEMRMDPTDIADVAGYTFLVNGKTPAQNFTALFKPGQRVRLRFINSAAMSYFDVRIPGLKMTVVQADGNNVQPVPVDEFRIAVAETYDVLVQPRDEKAYSILAESMDRTGFGRATLAPREGMAGEIPSHRPRPLLTMADMGSNFGPTGLDRGTPRPEMDAPGHVAPMEMDHAMGQSGTQSHTMPDGSTMPGMSHGSAPAPSSATHTMPDGSTMAGMDHSAMGHGAAADPLANDTGAPEGAKVLSYKDLKALSSPYDAREPDRIIEVRLTGNMERFFWSMNGRKYNEAQPIVLRYGERVRFRFINETMMNHPMHLHGMWMLPRVGNGARDPIKHVVNIKPGSSLDVDIPADAEGNWAFHCHLLYHMEAGMMRKVTVVREAAAND